jgi:hypothetical protein
MTRIVTQDMATRRRAANVEGTRGCGNIRRERPKSDRWKRNQSAKAAGAGGGEALAVLNGKGGGEKIC